MLSTLPRLDLALWAASVLATVILLFLLILRTQYRRVPFFTLYVASNLTQTCVQVFFYQIYGFESQLTYQAVWASQALVILTRALAAAEFCHLLLGRFVGVWGLARRILITVGTLILGVAVYFGTDGFRYGVMTLEIGMEAFVASLVIGTFLFSQYYTVALEPSLKLMGVGFAGYSCLKILNDLILSRYFSKYDHTWNVVAIIGYLGALALWVTAVRSSEFASEPPPQLNPVSVYEQVIPEVNQRLLILNEQLIRFGGMKQPKA